MPALWQASSASIDVRERLVLDDPGIVLQHDGVDESAAGGRVKNLRPPHVMRREADEFCLAGLADRLGRFFELLLSGHLIWVSVCWSPTRE